ncbi:MAG: hypothetical protein LBR24_04230 [Methanobrevibacter sp.]|jgi:hypothetical protein|nr:hypothetical protein [Methanobrevibacter sp.]
MEKTDYNQELDKLLLSLNSKMKEKKMYLDKYHTQKAIFQIKMDLGEDHPLYSHLPFYWYFYGPFSEPIADSLNFLKESPAKEDKRDKREIFSLYPELETIIDNLISNKKFFFNELPKRIYKKYAPYDCVYDFKFTLYDTADKKRSLENINTDEYVNTFFFCEGNLPWDKYFLDFSDIFSSFTTKIAILNNENKLSTNWPILREIIKKLWYSFAKGLRVKVMDDYYKDKTRRWDIEFKESIKTLEYYDNLIDISKLKLSPDLIEHDEEGKRLLNATLGSYLRSQ